MRKQLNIENPKNSNGAHKVGQYILYILIHLALQIHTTVYN